MGNRSILDTLLASIRQGLQGCYIGKQPLNSLAIMVSLVGIGREDGGESNSKHGPTVADALRDLSMALAPLADTLEKPAQIRWNREKRFR